MKNAPIPGDIPLACILGLEFVGSFVSGAVLGFCAECGMSTRHRGSFLGPQVHFECMFCATCGLLGENGLSRNMENQ